MMRRESPIVLAAGGTGGHMFPAQALAQELLARGRAVALITDRRGAAYANKFGRVDVHVVAASNPGGNLAAKGRAIADLGVGAAQAWRLMRRLAPCLVVGFGGYPSLPGMLAAALLGVPLCIHEQNAVLGRVNRLMARRASGIAASVADMGGVDHTKLTVTGNPVRAEIAALHGRAYQAPQADAPFNLLVFGGSQGAKILSDVVPVAIAMLPPAALSRLRIVQQCRAVDIERVRQAYGLLGVSADVRDFIEDMPAQLAAAHLVIARSGATTVGELTVAGTPSILVPYPHHGDQQQLANARALAAAGAAWLMPEAELSAAELAKRLQQLLRRPEQLGAAAAAAHALGRPDAAKSLADLVERLAAPSLSLPLSGGGESPPVTLPRSGGGENLVLGISRISRGAA